MSNEDRSNDSADPPELASLDTGGDHYARRRGSENQAGNLLIHLFKGGLVVGCMILVGFLISSCRDSFERKQKQRMQEERQEELENPVEPTWGK